MTADTRISIPAQWERCGLAIGRRQTETGESVAGDPCIVWDEEANGWRMVLFYAPPGHAQAICRDPLARGPWELEGPLPFSNPQALLGGSTHKPYIVMDAHHPNRAARIAGRYCLVTVSHQSGHKLIQQAWSERLSGPWTLVEDPLIGLGAHDEFDAKHADAVTGFFFPERDEILYFYMGYPEVEQPSRISPLGNAQGAALQRPGEPHARKLGPVLPPCQRQGHWASGWVGGLQLLPGRQHRWIGLVNASPTAPSASDTAVHREEPPPSLGGFAFCDEEFPTQGWQWCPEPIEWIEDIPQEALAAGEGVNLWRHHLLVLENQLCLFYNSGPYGREQLYWRRALRA
ncbi:MAG: hypothetical protein ACE149_08310 [Armatimonadota bacterium]